MSQILSNWTFLRTFIKFIYRQKIGQQWDKKITKNVVHTLKVLIEKELANHEEDEGHFSPS